MNALHYGRGKKIGLIKGASWAHDVRGR